MGLLATSAALMYLFPLIKKKKKGAPAIALAFVHQSHYLQVSLFCLLHQADDLRIGFSGFSLSKRMRRREGGGKERGRGERIEEGSGEGGRTEREREKKGENKT